jgi:hypothetical protein
MDKPKIDNREIEELFRKNHTLDEIVRLTGRSESYCKYRISLIKGIQEYLKPRSEKRQND